MGRASLRLSFVLTESQGENLFPYVLFLALSKKKRISSPTVKLDEHVKP